MSRPLRRTVAWLCGYSVMTAVLTWPLARDACNGVVDARIFGPVGGWWRQDVFLNLWILAWGAHALSTAPLRFWEGNALYPMTGTLAGSEHMLGYQWLFAPVYLISGNPVLANQVVVFMSFVLTALAVAVLARSMTGSSWAGWVAGSIVAFSPWRFGELTHIQLLGAFYLPLAVLGLARFLRDGSTAALGGAVAALVLQALTSFYLGYMAFFTVALLILPLLGRRAERRRCVGAAVGLLAAGLCVVPFALPYLRLRAAGIIPADPYDTPIAVAFYLHARPWRQFFEPGQPLYLGATAMALALLGCRRQPREIWPSRMGLLLVVVAGYVLALGPAWPIGSQTMPLPYRVLGWVLPGMSAIRYPMRFAFLTLFGVALLAARGVGAICDWLRRAPRPRLSAAAACLIITGGIVADLRTYGGAHVQTQSVAVGEAIPGVYHWLRTHGGAGVTVEVPVGDDSFPGWLRESQYMYFSTVHWLPLVNGFTGYPAPASTATRALARQLPAPEALAQLQASVGLRWIVVHRRDLDATQRMAWQTMTDRWPHIEFGDDVVVDVGQPE